MYNRPLSVNARRFHVSFHLPIFRIAFAQLSLCKSPVSQYICGHVRELLRLHFCDTVEQRITTTNSFTALISLRSQDCMLSSLLLCRVIVRDTCTASHQCHKPMKGSRCNTVKWLCHQLYHRTCTRLKKTPAKNQRMSPSHAVTVTRCTVH